jgi:hypothetical protein
VAVEHGRRLNHAVWKSSAHIRIFRNGPRALALFAQVIQIFCKILGTGTSVRAEDYQRISSDCLRLARESADPQTRVTLLSMAAAWTVLADWVEKRTYAATATDERGKLSPSS